MNKDNRREYVNFIIQKMPDSFTFKDLYDAVHSYEGRKPHMFSATSYQLSGLMRGTPYAKYLGQSQWQRIR